MLGSIDEAARRHGRDVEYRCCGEGASKPQPRRPRIRGGRRNLWSDHPGARPPEPRGQCDHVRDRERPMSLNSFGRVLRVTTWGESHGPAIGAVVDGCPPGLNLSETDIQAWLDKRRPGASRFTTQRRETDTVRILSGTFEGQTTGTPISLVIENEDQRSKDYADVANAYRPGHADYTYDAKYGFRDWRGGGRRSGRGAAARGAAGPPFLSNHAGGILGGISTGQPVVVRVAFKPTSSILTAMPTIDREGNETEIVTKGRHDPCVGIRAAPIVEAMMALVLADQKLLHRAQCG